MKYITNPEIHGFDSSFLVSESRTKSIIPMKNCLQVEQWKLICEKNVEVHQYDYSRYSDNRY